MESYHDRDHNIINGEQKEFAYNLVDFRGAEFIDMTGKNWDIENVDDLKEAYNKSFDFYKLDEKNEHRDINLTLLFNDNPDNDGFRQVYLVIVNSVSAAHNNTSGVVTGSVSFTGVGTAGVESTEPADLTSVKVGDTFTVTLKPGYTFGTVSGATRDGNKFTVSSTPVTIEILASSEGLIADKDKAANEKFGVTVNSEKSKLPNGTNYTIFFNVDRSDAVGTGTRVIPTANASGTISFKVYYAGAEIANTTAPITAGMPIAASAAIPNALLDETSQLYVEVISVKWDEVNVYYEYTGKHAAAAEAAGLKTGYTASLKAATYTTSGTGAGELPLAQAKIGFTLNVNSASTTQGAIIGGTYSASVSAAYPTPAAGGVNDTPVNANGTTEAAINGTTATTIIAGTAPVVVTINTDTLITYDQKIAITGFASKDLNDDFDTLADGAYTVSATAANVSAAAGTAGITLSWTAVAVTNPAVKVTLVVVDAEGNEVSSVSEAIVISNNNTVGSKSVELSGITAAGTVKVKSAEVLDGPTVSSVAGAPAATNWAANDKVTIFFNEELSVVSTTAADYVGDTIFMADPAVSAAAKTGDKGIELTLATPVDATAANGTISIAAGKIATAEGAYNTAPIVIRFTPNSVAA